MNYKSIRALKETSGIRVRLRTGLLTGPGWVEDFIYYPTRPGWPVESIVEKLYGKPEDGKGVSVVSDIVRLRK